MEFTLPDIIAKSTNTRYNPALGVAVNTLINTRIEKEYQEALQTATQILVGYDDVFIPNRKDYGTSSNFDGMPLFMPLLLKGIDGLQDLLLESAIVEASRLKNIGQTIIQGRNTSVKEWVNNGDYVISVKGLLCNNTPAYPVDQLVALNNFINLNKPIEIEHEKLNAVGIFQLVIFSDQLIQPTPHINVQPYSFTAQNDDPLPLIIQDQEIII